MNPDELIKTLAERVIYSPLSGSFVWRERQIERRGDAGWNARYAGQPAGSLKPAGYVNIGIRLEGKCHIALAHRIAWFIVNGVIPKGQIDHINQVKSDNRINNLRDVTCAENKKNLPLLSTNTSGVSGVYFNVRRQKLAASVRANGKRNHLGYFDDIDCANDAVRTFRQKNGFSELHGKRVD